MGCLCLFELIFVVLLLFLFFCVLKLLPLLGLLPLLLFLGSFKLGSSWEEERREVSEEGKEKLEEGVLE